MKDLAKLPQIAERQLGGLHATPKMLGEIKQRAASRPKGLLEGLRGGLPRGLRGLRPILSFGMAVILCFSAITVLTHGFAPTPGQPSPTPLVLDSQSAGGAEIASVQPAGLRALLDVPPGSVTIGGAVEAPAYRSIFAEAQGGNFPLILVNGAAYRMLETPSSVKESLLGESLGEVSEYTLEPALSTGGLVSNTVQQGDSVYAVRGMGGAMAAAKVNGEMRVFQRVSFAGSAIIGNEGLADTLCQASDVVSLELSDVGAFDDPEECQILISTLLDAAEYQSASVSSGGSQSLLIGLKNGLTLQLMVSGDSVSACGTWSCPEFFEGFTAMLVECE